MGDIQNAGGIRALKKVDRTKIRDRSGAQVGDSGGSSGAPAAGGAAGGGGGMADALAAALQKRKEKVSRSGKLDMTPSSVFIYIVLTSITQMMKTMTMTGKGCEQSGLSRFGYI